MVGSNPGQCIFKQMHKGESFKEEEVVSYLKCCRDFGKCDKFLYRSYG